MATAAKQPKLTGAALFAYIFRGAKARGLDPLAVLADVHGEGGLYGVTGDNGTSFGPFQLHKGGALPAGVTDPATWANTPAGVDYALNEIQQVAAGEHGPAAIYSIVSRFERPAASAFAGEVANDTAVYAKLSAAQPTAQLASNGDSSAQLIGFWGDVESLFLGPKESSLGGALKDSLAPPKEVQGAQSIGNSILPDWFNFNNAERAGEFAVGLVLVVVGLALLGFAAAKTGPVGQVTSGVGKARGVASSAAGG